MAGRESLVGVNVRKGPVTSKGMTGERREWF